MKQGKRVVNVIESRIQIFDRKVLVILFSELVALMKFLVLAIAGFAI